MTEVIAVWAEAHTPNDDFVMGRSATNDMPWPTNSEDLKHFRETTRDRVLIMGHNTFDSLPAVLKTPAATKERPLMVVVSSTQKALAILHEFQQSDVVPIVPAFEADTPSHALAMADIRWPEKDVAVIGGPRLLETFEPHYKSMVVTLIQGDYEGDVLAPSQSIFDHWVIDRKKSGALGPELNSYVYHYKRGL